MSKYLVKQPFISLNGNKYEVGDTYDDDGGRFIDGLIAFDFVERPSYSGRWRNKSHAGDKTYYKVVLPNIVTFCSERGLNANTADYNTGNYFKSQQTASRVAKALEIFFEYIHTVPGTPQQNVKNKLEQAQASARKAVLDDDQTF